MMDYKKIFKTREIRRKVLKMLRFVPDKTMLKIQYLIKTGRKLNLKDPKRYTEKIQWYKLYYRNPDMIRCVDKYDVRSYVEEAGCKDILNECYGVFDTAEEVDFDKLPEQFVLKDTLGGGGNSVIIVKDKSSADLDDLREQIKKWVEKPNRLRSGGREWPYYSGKKHRIIAEKYLITSESGDLPDYKFFCFDGKVFCSYMMQNYTVNHEMGELSFLDRDFKLMNVHRKDFNPITQQPQKPKKYDSMVALAEILSKDFPHVRVDFFDVEGEIVFGELTFFGSSGYLEFEPDAFDYEMGEKFSLRKLK